MGSEPKVSPGKRVPGLAKRRTRKALPTKAGVCKAGTNT